MTIENSNKLLEPSLISGAFKQSFIKLRSALHGAQPCNVYG